MRFEILKGFTLIETLVATAVLALLAAIAAGAFSSFQDSGELLRSADLVAGVLRDARGRTLASKNDTAYGAHFDSGQVVLFEGPAYSAGAAANEITALPFRIEISVVTLGGGNDVAFRRLSGEATATGTIILRAKRNPAKTKTAQIYESGVVEIK